MGKVGSRSRKGEKRELPVGRWGLGDHAQLCWVAKGTLRTETPRVHSEAALL